MRTLLFVLLSSVSAPAIAGGSLGISGASFSLGMAETEDGSRVKIGTGTVDVAITDHHGFQGDLSYGGTGFGDIGTLAAHLYMTPKEGQKYGLFAALSDVDGRSMLYGSIGAEGMFSLGQDTTLELRAGTGWADTDGLDYIFAGAALTHAVTPEFNLEVSLDIADFEEISFDATSYDVGLKTTYSPEGSPFGLYASITSSGLTGADSAPAETRLGLGLTVSLGASGGASPHTRPFRTPDPVAPLVRRGLW